MRRLVGRWTPRRDEGGQLVAGYDWVPGTWQARVGDDVAGWTHARLKMGPFARGRGFARRADARGRPVPGHVWQSGAAGPSGGEHYASRG